MKIILSAVIILLSWLTTSAQEEYAFVRFPDGQTYACEIADSPMERYIGLSEHTFLPINGGMLFVYDKPSYTSFWMPPKMKFSLDIIFLDDKSKIIHISSNAQPCKNPHGYDCPSFSPEAMVVYVLEVNAEEASNHNLKIGDLLEITFPSRQ